MNNNNKKSAFFGIIATSLTFSISFFNGKNKKLNFMNEVLMYAALLSSVGSGLLSIYFRLKNNADINNQSLAEFTPIQSVRGTMKQPADVFNDNIFTVGTSIKNLAPKSNNITRGFVESQVVIGRPLPSLMPATIIEAPYVPPKDSARNIWE